MTEKGKEAIDRAKELVKKAAGAVTPGGGGDREYFSNLLKETNERSVKGALRKYFQNLIKETSERSAERSHRTYFSSLLKETSERSIKGPYRSYFNKLIKESKARSTQSLVQEQRTAMIKDTLLMAISQAREGVGEVGDPRAQALYETTAETLQGLLTAYEHK